MPSQQQVRWSQLRVGLTVLFASITLAVLIFLMSGPSGLFSRKLLLYAYFDNAGGLRTGAPVRLEGVDIGNVTDIRVVQQNTPNPVRVQLKVTANYNNYIKKDSLATLATAGVLGETFVDIDSRQAKEGIANNGDTLKTLSQPDIQDVVRSSQGTLQNIDVLLRRIDRIMAFVESGQGSIGKLIYDESLYKRLNSTLTQVQDMVNEISSGKGSVGKLIVSDDLYNKANASVDKLNQIIDEINAGNGTMGKFIKDPSLYNNANETIAKANALMSDVNAGKGALGKFAKDEAFAKKLDDTITNLEQLTQKMNSGDGTVGKLMTDPSVFNNTDQMLVETRNLVTAIRQNPKKYLTIHFKVF
ncbi:MAG TPA: MlaD family protein [Terriglobales bacterium]|nr:MlaD family protein [Terriglobales bacterium]